MDSDDNEAVKMPTREDKKSDFSTLERTLYPILITLEHTNAKIVT